MTTLSQVRTDVFAETPEFAERMARVYIPGTGPIPKACLITVENGMIIVYTLNATDSAIPLLNKTKVLEKSY